MAEIDDLRGRIAAVRVLHSPMHSHLGDVYCSHCSNQEMVEWPCLTVEALGPREDSDEDGNEYVEYVVKDDGYVVDKFRVRRSRLA